MVQTTAIQKKSEDLEKKFLDFQSPKLIDAFIRSLNVMNSSRTQYRRGVKYFCLWLKEKKIEIPKEICIHDYLEDLEKRGLKATTINTYLIACRKFFEFLQKYGFFPDIAKDVKTLAVPKGYLRDPLEASQVRSLVDSIDKSTSMGFRDYAIISLMARTGLRSHSIVKADLKDLGERGGEKILRYLSKGHQSKDLWVVLKDDVYKILIEYIRTREGAKPVEPLFISYSDRNGGLRLTTATIRGMVKARLKAIGIVDDRLSCHSLRHFFGSRAAENGATPIQIMHAMGHRNISTTMNYVRDWGRLANPAENLVNF